MAQFYSDPSRASDKYALPDCEVFYVEAGEWWYDDNGERCDEPACVAEAGHDESFRDTCGECSDKEPCAAGWYYWFCFPGCMPDSEPNGPYETEEAAIEACRETFGGY